MPHSLSYACDFNIMEKYCPYGYKGTDDSLRTLSKRKPLCNYLKSIGVLTCPLTICQIRYVVDCVWNLMAHVQKPNFFFRRNGRVHLNRRGRQFSRLQAAEVCASAVVMLDTPRFEVVWEYWLPTQFPSFPFTSPPFRNRVPSGFKRTLHSLSWMFKGQ